MKKYHQYRDSLITWIGEIPAHWEEQKIKYFATCNDNSLLENTDADMEIEYVEIGDVSLERGVFNFTKYTFEKAPSRARRITQKNDVIISTVRTYLKAIARIDRENLIVSTGFAVLRPKNINNDFMAFALQNKSFIDKVISLSYGVNYPAITAEKLCKIPIPLPPAAEQAQIVKYLDGKTQLIDKFIAEKEREIGLLLELKQAEIARAVTQGLNPKVKMKNSAIAWLGDIPAHWEERRAKYMFIRMNRPTREEDEIITCFRDGQVTLRQNRRTQGFTEAIQEIGYQGIRKGDLVIHQMDAFAGAIGVSDSDGKGTPVYSCCTPVGDYFTHYYAYVLREMARTDFIKSLYKGIRERTSDFRYDIFAKQILPLPPLSEQEAIVSYINGKVLKIEEYISLLRSELVSLKEYKQVLVSDVVCGRRCVLRAAEGK